ncbi:MAG: radical SAM protein [Chloroflexota bacterium]|nr:radical SAM protein [Chloroflexota bacterium]
MDTSATPLSQFIIKSASRCNLNCSYCYVYNKGDLTWRARPAIMSDETFKMTIARIRRHCLFSGQRSVILTFHGGEPCLIAPGRFDSWCNWIAEQLADIVTVQISIQTNGTLLNPSWIDVLSRHNVDVGVSMDGPKNLHDVFRVDHKGRGSYDAVERGLMLLRDSGIRFGILSVVQLGADPLIIHHHFLGLGCKYICYLLPAYTHDTIGPIRERYGPHPCADFLLPIFDDWWFNSTLDVRIREFWTIARLIMGGTTDLDSFGNPPIRFVSVETDGEIHGLDKLRICEDGYTRLGLNVYDGDFRDFTQTNALHAHVLAGMLLPQACNPCPERDTCAGGYLPHRYSRAHGFDNPSVWCADLLAIFTHIRERLGVSVEDTRRRREALAARQPVE